MLYIVISAGTSVRVMLPCQIQEMDPGHVALAIQGVHLMLSRVDQGNFSCKCLGKVLCMLIHSQSDCKCTEVMAVRKYTAMITVKITQSYCNYEKTESLCIFTVTLYVNYGNIEDDQG